jgi:hypothetical protein
MSTLAYGAVTRKREESTPGSSSTDQPPGVQGYVDIFVALVPAEVLAFHAFAFSVASANLEDPTQAVLPGWLFWVLCVLCVVFYLFSHSKEDFDGLDIVRALIPAFAFVGWTMLQRPSVFDSVNPGLGDLDRVYIAAIGALILGGLTELGVIAADRKGRQGQQGQPAAE